MLALLSLAYQFYSAILSLVYRFVKQNKKGKNNF